MHVYVVADLWEQSVGATAAVTYTRSLLYGCWRTHPSTIGKGAAQQRKRGCAKICRRLRQCPHRKCAPFQLLGRLPRSAASSSSTTSSRKSFSPLKEKSALKSHSPFNYFTIRRYTSRCRCGTAYRLLHPKGLSMLHACMTSWIIDSRGLCSTIYGWLPLPHQTLPHTKWKEPRHVDARRQTNQNNEQQKKQPISLSFPSHLAGLFGKYHASTSIWIWANTFNKLLCTIHSRAHAQYNHT